MLFSVLLVGCGDSATNPAPTADVPPAEQAEVVPEPTEKIGVSPAVPEPAVKTEPFKLDFTKGSEPIGSISPSKSMNLEALINQFGQSAIVTIRVTDAPANAEAALLQQLKPMLAPAQIVAEAIPQRRICMLVVAPISDLRALANKIPFGNVESIDEQTRTISVDYDF